MQLDLPPINPTEQKVARQVEARGRLDLECILVPPYSVAVNNLHCNNNLFFSFVPDNRWWAYIRCSTNQWRIVKGRAAIPKIMANAAFSHQCVGFSFTYVLLNTAAAALCFNICSNSATKNINKDAP